MMGEDDDLIKKEGNEKSDSNECYNKNMSMMLSSGWGGQGGVVTLGQVAREACTW